MYFCAGVQEVSLLSLFWIASMAAAGNDLVAKFQEFCSLAGSQDATLMTSKASGKLVADCFDEGYKEYDVKSICDAIVFPPLREKGKLYMVVNTTNVDKYISNTAHEIAKKKTDNTEISEDDAEVMTIKADLIKLVIASKSVKQSATGDADEMTDASHYTGAHEESFNARGKGKRIEGSSEVAGNTGYVGNSKGKGSFGKK